MPRSLCAGALTVLVAAAACGGGTPREEQLKSEVEVLRAVRDTASRVTASLGSDVRCGEWYWDTEDIVWECPLTGLDRIAELDIGPHGEPSELEFVYSMPEIRDAIPHAYELIGSTCGTGGPSLIELSIRRDELYTSNPDIRSLWETPGIFLEVQCANGHDFEVDAFGSLVTTPEDDIDRS